jgi:hypothetical protein
LIKEAIEYPIMTEELIKSPMILNSIGSADLYSNNKKIDPLRNKFNKAIKKHIPFSMIDTLQRAKRDIDCLYCFLGNKDYMSMIKEEMISLGYKKTGTIEDTNEERKQTVEFIFNKIINDFKVIVYDDIFIDTDDDKDDDDIDDIKPYYFYSEGYLRRKTTVHIVRKVAIRFGKTTTKRNIARLLKIAW